MGKCLGRAARAAALLGWMLAACASESDDVDAAPPPERGQVSYALEGEPDAAADAGAAADTDAAAPDAGSTVSLCVNELAALTPLECAACAQDHCAPEAASCGEDCGALITCASDNCAPRDIGCISSSCFDCLGPATIANLYANCLDEHCATACPAIARLAIPLQPPPPPPPSGPSACVDDLPSALGLACTSCIDRECAEAATLCDGTCRSFITCAFDACGNEDLGCLTDRCGDCFGGANAAVTLGGCITDRCAAVCPSRGSSDPPDAGADAGDADDDDAHQQRPHKPNPKPPHHPRGPK